ncbi:MAG: phenylalanine--tRNA ligase subunit beta [Chloroflexota bacterium]|nr:phenylalanine--tRNA ligase subunit beta [Chloroflexota bacterium]
MRVPLTWLRDYVDIALSPAELAERLTLRGMEVSGIETTGADWTDVVVGRLLWVEQHPNADKLTLTTVDVGDAKPLHIVCGATNIAPGQLVPVARVGALLPGERRIERSKIRGVQSEGMLCSAAELRLGSDAEGIHILPDGVAIGTPLAELLGEVVLDIDVKPNRGDALSMVGLAREVAAFSGSALREPLVSLEETDEPASDRISVRIDEPDLCPRFTARYFEGVSIGPSPEWMQRRLLAAGMRPISAVVDVTNYVMHELGQPMHAYDADAIPDGLIVVRRAHEGERLETIDHVQRVLDPRMLVIADASAAIGLAGIMGGASTEVGSSTTRVILESAIFDGPTIRNTARRLGLRSEASARHEKGIGPDLPRGAIDRAAQLIAEISGARVARGIVDNDPNPKPQRTIALDLARIERLLGIPLTAQRVDELLRPLGFETESAGDGLNVTVPSFRVDVTEPADVAEEIARAEGYERIPARAQQPTLPSHRPDPTAARERVRRVLAGLGLDETVTYALIAPADLARAGHPATGDHLVGIANPLAVDHSVLRPVICPSLLGSLRDNARQRRADAWLFEVGKVYWYHPGDPTPRERRAETAGTGRYESWELGIALLGHGTPRSMHGADEPADVASLKGIVEALHEALGAPLPSYLAEPADDRHPHRHPGRTARILDTAGRAYGSLGEVHPQIAAEWDLPGRPVDASLDLDHLLGLIPETTRAVAVPSAQPIDRDLAVVLERSTSVGELLRITRMSAGPMLANLRLFDAYEGPQVGEGRVSYALALRFQPGSTADETAVEKALNRVRGSLRHHLGAEIR